VDHTNSLTHQQEKDKKVRPLLDDETQVIVAEQGAALGDTAVSRSLFVSGSE